MNIHKSRFDAIFFVRPTWGQIPTSAQWIFTDLGLNLFIACVGLSAGPQAIAALTQAGITIFVAGTCTAALNSVIDDAGGPMPVIGYTVPYAIGNVLLTVWGALIVNII